MLKERRLYADQVAATLFEAETAIDAAIAKAAALAGVMPGLRPSGVSAVIGQDAYEWTSKSLLSLTDARRAIIEAHHALSAAQKQIGLGAGMYGDPKPFAQAEEVPVLRAVETEETRAA